MNNDNDVEQLNIQQAGLFIDENPAIEEIELKERRARLFDENHLAEEIMNERGDTNRKIYLQSMLQSGDSRKVVEVTPDAKDRLIKLGEKFPNFESVIRRCLGAVALRILGKSSLLRLPPFLLVGEPGIGKTRFLKELANLLSTEFYQIDMSCTSASFVLAGGNTQWRDGKPGLITKALQNGEVINPFILIDELDKAMEGSNYDPLGPLYTLLERETAKTFRDEALELTLDCSWINWVASANYPEMIPQPLRDRLVEIKIEPPTKKQMKAVVLSVYHEMLDDEDWGTCFSRELNEDVIKALNDCRPREVKMILENTCGAVAMRSEITESPLVLTLFDLPRECYVAEPSICI